MPSAPIYIASSISSFSEDDVLLGFATPISGQRSMLVWCLFCRQLAGSRSQAGPWLGIWVLGGFLAGQHSAWGVKLELYPLIGKEHVDLCCEYTHNTSSSFASTWGQVRRPTHATQHIRLHLRFSIPPIVLRCCQRQPSRRSANSGNLEISSLWIRLRLRS